MEKISELITQGSQNSPAIETLATTTTEQEIPEAIASEKTTPNLSKEYGRVLEAASLPFSLIDAILWEAMRSGREGRNILGGAGTGIKKTIKNVVRPWPEEVEQVASPSSVLGIDGICGTIADILLEPSNLIGLGTFSKGRQAFKGAGRVISKAIEEGGVVPPRRLFQTPQFIPKFSKYMEREVGKKTLQKTTKALDDAGEKIAKEYPALKPIVQETGLDMRAAEPYASRKRVEGVYARVEPPAATYKVESDIVELHRPTIPTPQEAKGIVAHGGTRSLLEKVEPTKLSDLESKVWVGIDSKVKDEIKNTMKISIPAKQATKYPLDVEASKEFISTMAEIANGVSPANSPNPALNKIVRKYLSDAKPKAMLKSSDPKVLKEASDLLVTKRQLDESLGAVKDFLKQEHLLLPTADEFIDDLTKKSPALKDLLTDQKSRLAFKGSITRGGRIAPELANMSDEVANEFGQYTDELVQLYREGRPVNEEAALEIQERILNREKFDRKSLDELLAKPPEKPLGMYAEYAEESEGLGRKGSWTAVEEAAKKSGVRVPGGGTPLGISEPPYYQLRNLEELAKE
jgi:hypothetical protein